MYGRAWNETLSDALICLSLFSSPMAAYSSMSPRKSLYGFAWYPRSFKYFSYFFGLNQTQFTTLNAIAATLVNATTEIAKSNGEMPSILTFSTSD